MNRFKKWPHLGPFLVLILLSLGLLPSSAAAQVENHLTEFPIVDPLNRAETPLSNEGKWSALAWDAATSTPTGRDTASGWSPMDTYPSVNGAFWNQERSSWIKGEETIAATMGKAPSSGRYFSLWIDMPRPSETKSGYELRYLQNKDSTFTVTLSTWVNGTQTVLTSKPSVSIPAGSTVGLNSSEYQLEAWVETSGKLTEVADASHSSPPDKDGFFGIEGSGVEGRLNNFRAGSQTLKTVEGEIAAVPVADDLNRSEAELSNGGKWSALGWTTSTIPRGAVTAGTFGGWRPTNAYPATSGAYWNQASFNDANGGNAASVTMVASPGSEDSYLSLWLNMAQPGLPGKEGKTGIQLKWRVNTGGKKGFEVTLNEWQGGESFSLDSEPEALIPVGTTISIYDSGEVVYALMSGPNGKLVPFLSAHLVKGVSPHSGYAGFEGSGTGGHIKDFRVGPPALPAGIAALPMRDELRSYDIPLFFGGKWQKTSWVPNTGMVQNSEPMEGWYPLNSTEDSGAYWSPTTFSGTNGEAVSLAMSRWALDFDGHYQAVWLNMTKPGSEKSGYEARWMAIEDPRFKQVLTISKWVNGKQTVLASKGVREMESAVIGVGNPITLTYQKGTLTLWEGGLTYLPLLSASDSTFTGGYAGIQTGGPASTQEGAYKFRAGTL